MTKLLEVQAVSKKLTPALRRALRYGLSDMLGELLRRPASGQLRRDEFWALDDVSFELEAGEALALMGQNGAGKSTLLKLLFGLLKPDKGTIRVTDRTEAIIELGTGSHPLLTGRENIALGAALHRLTGCDARRLADQVIAFAELDHFIDAPVQTYSVGMKARLSYALAVHLQPRLLLIDEALAVGDVAFQRKCIEQMRSYVAEGGALILVSHNVYQVQAVCTRGLVLDQGKLTFSGSAVEAVSHMITATSTRAAAALAPRPRGSYAMITELRLEPEHGDQLRTGEPACLILCYQTERELRIVTTFSIWSQDLLICVAGVSAGDGARTISGSGEIVARIARLPIMPGDYVLRAGLLDPDTQFPHALFGWQNAPSAVRVAHVPSAEGNAQIRSGQLTRLEIHDWG